MSLIDGKPFELLSKDGKLYKIGKIKKIYFGHGGVGSSCIGLFVEFSLDSGSTGICTSLNWWDCEQYETKGKHELSDAQMNRRYSEIVRHVCKILKTAKKKCVADLVGTPVVVSITEEGNGIVSDWRVLQEVL